MSSEHPGASLPYRRCLFGGKKKRRDGGSKKGLWSTASRRIAFHKAKFLLGVWVENNFFSFFFFLNYPAQRLRRWAVDDIHLITPRLPLLCHLILSEDYCFAILGRPGFGPSLWREMMSWLKAEPPVVIRNELPVITLRDYVVSQEHSLESEWSGGRCGGRRKIDKMEAYLTARSFFQPDAFG